MALDHRRRRAIVRVSVPNFGCPTFLTGFARAFRRTPCDIDRVAPIHINIVRLIEHATLHTSRNLTAIPRVFLGKSSHRLRGIWTSFALRHPQGVHDTPPVHSPKQHDLTGASRATDRRDDSCLIVGRLRAPQASSWSPRRSPPRPRCRRSASARACGRASCTPRRTTATTRTSSCSTARGSTSTGPSPTRSSSCSTPSMTAPRTRSACWTRSRDSRCRRSSTSGWDGSCRRAIARTCTVPYYAHHWGVYTDGIQNGHPFIFQGRDNGVAYWGDFGKVKVSAGAFDGQSASGNPDILGAARVQIDFWDKENGYYLNGTYYGGKNLLGVGAAIQAQSGNTATTVDFLLEKKAARRRRVLDRERVRQLRRAGRLRRAIRVERRCLHPRQLPVSEAGRRHGPVRDSRQVRTRRASPRSSRSPTTTRTPPSSTSTTSSRNSTRG